MGALRLCCLALLAGGTQAASDDESITLADALKFISLTPDDRHVEPAQPLKVIGAGFGRTGTSSLVVALRRLGLHSYHMKEGIMETPGHADAWMEHARVQWEALGSGEPVSEASWPGLAAETDEEEKILDMIARDGFNATTDIPPCLLYRKMLRRYPEARVVLTVRSSGAAWARSVLGTTGQNCEVMSKAPWRWIPFMRRFLVLNKWLWAAAGAPCDPATGKLDAEKLAAAHDAWTESVKVAVPSEQLLIFQAKEGYAPLCEFLSPVDPEVARKCAEVLQSREAYPHVNDTANMQRIYKIFWALTTPWPYLALVVCVALAKAKCCGGAKGKED